MQEISFAPHQAHDGQPQPIGAAGMARREYAMRRIIQKGLAHKFNFPSAIKVINQDEMRKRVNIFQPVFVFWENFDLTGSIRDECALNRGGFFYLKRRMNSANWSQYKSIHHV